MGIWEVPALWPRDLEVWWDRLCIPRGPHVPSFRQGWRALSLLRLLLYFPTRGVLRSPSLLCRVSHQLHCSKETGEECLPGQPQDARAEGLFVP